MTIPKGFFLHKGRLFKHGGPGSGHRGHKGRPGQVGGSTDDYGNERKVVGHFQGKPVMTGWNELSKKDQIKEATRVAPILKKVGDRWKKEILKYDKKAKIEIRGTWMYLDIINWDEHGDADAWIEISGTTSKGEGFGLGISLYPDKDGNTVKMNDSGLPDSLQRKGIFSAGMSTLVNTKELNLSGKASVHHSTNDKAWKTIFQKFDLNWKDWQEL
jgi:hypothetical protein